MKINSINTINYNNKVQSFKHSAVPYPEFENAYYYVPDTFESKVSSLVFKIAALFSPKVTKEAMEIKSGIDSIYDSGNSKQSKDNSRKYLLSVLA